MRRLTRAWRLLGLLPILLVVGAVVLGPRLAHTPSRQAGSSGPGAAASEVAASPSSSLPPARPPKAPPKAQAGFNLLLYGSDPNYGDKAGTLIERLRADGVNSLALTFPFYMDRTTASAVRIGKDTPPDSELDGIVRIAQAAGLSAMVRPVLDDGSLMAAEGGWRGSLYPTSRSEWFTSYGQLILRYAVVAERAGADTLDIGTELVSMESETASWLRLIGDVRAVYHGQVTYSFNDQVNATFWRALDFVSIDAYPRLTLPADPSASVLAAAWTAYATGIKRSSAPKPFVITELGIVPDRRALVIPYRWYVTGAADYSAQDRFYEATCAALQSAAASGIYWWNVGLDPGSSPFDVLGTKTEERVRACFLHWGA